MGCDARECSRPLCVDGPSSWHPKTSLQYAWLLATLSLVQPSSAWQQQLSSDSWQRPWRDGHVWPCWANLVDGLAYPWPSQLPASWQALAYPQCPSSLGDRGRASPAPQQQPAHRPPHRWQPNHSNRFAPFSLLRMKAIGMMKTINNTS